MRNSLVIGLAVCVALSSRLTIAATDSTWQILFDSGNTLRNCTLVKLRRDSLAVVCLGKTSCVAVASITKLIRVGKSRVWTGVVVGALIGGGVGALIASEVEPSFAGVRGAAAIAYCMLGGSVVGGAIGAAVGTDDEFDLSDMSLPERINKIDIILFEYERR